MSKLLRARLGIAVALGTSPSDLLNIFANEMNLAGWQEVQRSDVDGNRFIDVIPPATEAIGNEVARGVLRLSIGGTGNNTLTLQPYTSPKTAYGNSYRIFSNIASVSAAAPRLKYGASNNVAIALPGSNVDSNTAAIYNFLIASNDPDVTQYTYQLVVVNASSADDYIIATPKTPSAPAITNADATASVVNRSTAIVANGVAQFLPSSASTLPIDLGSGFVYYLSIHERTIALATKTTAAFGGPVYASYADHASALAQTPLGCSPVELVVVNLNALSDGGNPTVSGITHFWGMSPNSSITGSMRPIYDNAVRSVGVMEDMWGTGSSLPDFVFRPLNGSSITAASWAAVTGMATGVLGANLTPRPVGTTSALGFLPTLALPDVNVFVGAATDEAIQFTQGIDDPATLTAAIGVADATIPLADTSKFVNAGVAMIGNEAIEYTGKTANSLTGVTRGRFSTVAAAAAAGAKVYPALWYMKAKGGVLLAGYVKPVNA